jgi:glycosyltransferase involved in cell wall biosynthesis
MNNKSKKIIISCSATGSLVNFRGKLIEELVKNNQVYVFTPKIRDNNLLVQLNNLGVTICENNLLRNNVSIWGDIQYILQLRKIIKAVKPDIFFAYTFKPIIFGSIIASFCGVKGIVAMLTGLGYNFTDSAKKSTVGRITHKLLRFSLKSSGRVKVVFQNQDDYKELIDYKIIDNNSKAYIVNGSGVDLSRYEYSVPDTNNISFLMMARLIKAKGVREYYEAASILKQKYPHVRFTLIGFYETTGIDSIDTDLYEQIRSNKILEFHGWVDDVRPFIKDSSVVVLPSFYREGIPRSVQEGMAMGRAIITTDAIGCKETVNPDKENPNGFLIPIKDVSALVEKMEYFINKPQEIIRFGENGRKYTEEKFDVNKVNKHMLEILDVA